MSGSSSFTSGAKQFKDPVYGYIALSANYAELLIDTPQMQRIKGVAQTGIRPVFAAATHDRFCHSLGVYKFGDDIFRSLQARVIELVKSFEKEPRWEKFAKDSSLISKVKENLAHWKVLLHIACLLHDIGHPVQSHGFEFLYDDLYLDCEGDIAVRSSLSLNNGIPTTEYERIYKAHKEFFEGTETGKEAFQSKLSLNIVSAINKLTEEMPNTEILTDEVKIPGNPHERMSVYYILTDEDLKDNIKELIIRESPKNIKESSDKIENYKETEFPLDLIFIARMIIGWEYEVTDSFVYDEDNFMNSIRNCIIHILNGIVDADGMDYLMRNAYSAGYDTSKVDYDRLCGAYSVYEKNYLVYPAFSKSALSALEGYISARQFEPKWLYSHHKVVYADLIIKQIYKYAVKYLTDKTVLADSICRVVREYVKESESSKSESNLLLADTFQSTKLSGIQKLRAHMEQWSYPFYTYMLAPFYPIQMNGFSFYRMVDADFESLIHVLTNEFCKIGYEEYCKSIKTAAESAYRILDGELDETERQRVIRMLIADQNLKLSSETLSESRNQWINCGSAEVLQKLKQGLPLKNINWERFRTNYTAEDFMNDWLVDYEPLLTQRDFQDFQTILKEYQARRYKQSLWKSYAEYRLFLKDCEKETSLPSERIHRYMVDLITKGMLQKGFSIFEGRASANPPGSYKEQFYYIPMDYRIEEDRFLACEIKHAARIFSNERIDGKDKEGGTDGEYNFSNGNVVVKFYRMKFKSFDKLNLMFRDRVVNIRDVIDLETPQSIEFPYIFYSQNGINRDKEKVLQIFRKKFIDYCSDKYNCEAIGGASSNIDNYTYRDSVYGDIHIPKCFFEVICTKEFQRLRHIKQLSTAEHVFLNATHTRYAHSIGTWYVMTQILQHFELQFSQFPEEMRPSQEEKNALLLAALLHDLGHGPYSHSFEEIVSARWNHEEQGIRILEDPTSDIRNRIINNFGALTFENVLKLLNKNSFASQQSLMSVIYHSLISSQLDADRIDYIMRDNKACGLAYGYIDMQQIVNAMSLDMTYTHDKPSFRLCFNSHYLPAIDQFVYARYQMFRNVYHEPRKLFYEKLFERIMKEMVSLHDFIKQTNITKIIYNYINDNVISAQDFMLLDDESIDAQIRKWADGEILIDTCTDSKAQIIARKIQCLSRAFLGYDSSYISVDLGNTKLPYEQLARGIGGALGQKDCTNIQTISEELASFFFVEKNSYAYLYEPKDDNSILIRNEKDGILCDYYECSMFVQSSNLYEKKIWESYNRCLFFSKDILRNECADKFADKGSSVYNDIVNIVEQAQPRKHIEIEKKYICDEETLKAAIEYLNSYENGQYEAKFVSEQAQIDTYFDQTINGSRLLYAHGFSFRMRCIENNNSIFTLKGGVNSLNYHTKQQLARHEYEKQLPTATLNDEAIAFLKESLSTQGEDGFAGEITKNTLKPQLRIKNARTVVRFRDIKQQCDVCEFCLDKVNYQDPDGNEIGNLFQIEIELLEQPKYWFILELSIIKSFEEEMRKQNRNLISESKSKLDIGYYKLRQCHIKSK